jgi:predicted nucleic acid-binding protein
VKLYLDTSALVKLYVEEEGSERVIFACWDRRLEEAARAEGLDLLRPAR